MVQSCYLVWKGLICISVLDPVCCTVSGFISHIILQHTEHTGVMVQPGIVHYVAGVVQIFSFGIFFITELVNL